MSATQIEQRHDPIHAIRPDAPGLSGAGQSGGGGSSSYVLAMTVVGFMWILACVALFGWAMISMTG